MRRLNVKFLRFVLFLADQISATGCAHARRMHSFGGDVETVARVVSFRIAVHGDRHLSVENDVRGFTGMHVIGIESVGAILPNVRGGKSLGAKLSFERLFVHDLCHVRYSTTGGYYSSTGGEQNVDMGAGGNHPCYPGFSCAGVPRRPAET